LLDLEFVVFVLQLRDPVILIQYGTLVHRVIARATVFGCLTLLLIQVLVLLRRVLSLLQLLPQSEHLLLDHRVDLIRYFEFLLVLCNGEIGSLELYLAIDGRIGLVA
jgi:hypothetical protein